MDSQLVYLLLPIVWVVAALGVQRTRGQNRALYLSFGAITVTLVVGLWLLIAMTEQFWTEANLAGYYCCVTERDLPPAGSAARAISDFFASAQGSVLASTLFLAGSVGLTLRALRRSAQPMVVMAVVLLLAVLYLVADFSFVALGWQISEAVNGPERSVFSGLERTIYGIVLHFLLWAGYFWALARADRIAARQSPLRLRVTD